jgi:hypothetical protein
MCSTFNNHLLKAEVKGEDGQLDRLVFEGLTWRARRHPCRRVAAAGGLTASQDVHVYLFPLPGGSAEVIIKLVRGWVGCPNRTDTIITSQGSKTGCIASLLSYYCKTRKAKKKETVFGLQMEARG